MNLIRTLIVATLVSSAAAISGQQRTEPPNILIIVVDDLGWGDVSYHKATLPTPNIDRLAKDGVELARFYVYPVCSPTRAALISGQMPRRFGIVNPLGPRQAGMPAGLPTLPGAFQSAGYQTSLIGKWHVGTASPPTRSGFDHFYGFMGPQVDYFKHTNQLGVVDWQRDGQTVNEEGYSTFLLADEAIRQIEHRDPKRPFFFEVAFNAPHFPIMAPEEYMARQKDLGGRNAAYAAVVDALDVSIGRVLAALDKQGLRENTLVWFFSDNGAGPREGGSNGVLRSGKGSVYEGGIRTPCLVRWPGHLAQGAVSQQPIATQDLFPTLAAAAGVPLPGGAKLDGRDIWPALREGRTIAREPFLIASIDTAIIDGDWKLIETQDGQHSLFHISSDISETTDLLAREPEIAGRLVAKLGELKKDLPAAVQRPGPGGGGGRPPGPRGAAGVVR
ncbi:MAG: sulfatase-like hydrolase/transferase [Tepidisphaeraceae bacterium]|jgi:arylsulfatase A-like enzyme